MGGRFRLISFTLASIRFLGELKEMAKEGQTQTNARRFVPPPRRRFSVSPNTSAQLASGTSEAESRTRSIASRLTVSY